MNSPSLNGMTLHVADVERSLQFYSKIPGAEQVVHREGEFALLQIGSGRLGLLNIDHGDFHLEIETDDFDSLCRQLREEGMDVDDPSEESWGEYDTLIEDPDGNVVEFGIEWDEDN